jgi:C1A family cysteine protease
MAKKKPAYGWIPDRPDQRDFLFAAASPVLRSLPVSVDLRRQCPPVYDQGALGSCTANAIAAAVQFDLMKQKQKTFIPSRLFLYYNERVMEDSVDSDAGAMLRDGMKSVAKDGDCPEELWPYNVAKFAVKPPDSCYREAMRHQALKYQRVSRDLTQMKGCLAAGYPFVFGFTVYESFETAQVARTGHAALPRPSERVMGGHAVLAVGYDEAKGWILRRNSWGNKWGMKGYFTLPYAYLLNANLSGDFWTIRLME